MTIVTTPTPAQAGDRGHPWPRRRSWPLLAMLGTGFLLLDFYAFSQTVRVPFGIFPHPPMYGRWNPVLEPLALWVVPAGLLLCAVAWLVTSSRRLPPWLALALVVAGGVAMAAAIAVVRGDWHDLVKGVSTAPDAPYYTSDLHLVYDYGVRGFVERHPDLVDIFGQYNSKTHPPGVLLFFYLLYEIFGQHPLRITTAMAAMSLGAAAAVWSMGRTIGGERAGRIAAVLFVAAPGPLLLAYTSMDAIFAAVLSTSVALFMVASHRASPLVAAGAGAVLGVGTLLTYATGFVALAATIAVAIQAGSVRTAARLLGAAAAGGLAVLALARVTLGFDLLASYAATPRSRTPYDPYWILAHPASVFIWAGLPLAALGVAGLFLRVPGARRPVLALVLVALMLVWGALPAVVTGLRYGEVERTWAFLYPVLAAAAGPVVDRWTRGCGRWSGAVVAGLVALSVGQAALLQALWNNLA